jgi:uncharacterized membrane protein
MPMRQFDDSRKSPLPKPTPDVLTLAATVGVIAAGVALFEAALIPGLAIGAVAVLAPGLASKRLPRLRRGLQTLFDATVRRAPAARASDAKPPLAALPRLGVKQALAKTVTYRVTVTTLDLTWNYLIIGELATAAGLSAFSLVVGPVFYFAHEAAWNYYAAPIERADGRPGAVVELPLRRPAGRAGITINRALAKTIVFHTVGTAMDFTVNYAVVLDLVSAALLTAPRFVIGPFVYLGHEMAWDYFSAPRSDAVPIPQALLAAPA